MHHAANKADERRSQVVALITLLDIAVKGFAERGLTSDLGEDELLYLEVVREGSSEGYSHLGLDIKSPVEVELQGQLEAYLKETEPHHQRTI